MENDELYNFKTNVYLLEGKSPSAVHIVSEKLCLDHTFFVKASGKPFTLDDIKTLQQSPAINRLRLCFDNDSLVMVSQYEESGKIHISDISGWINAMEFNFFDIKDANLKEIDKENIKYYSFQINDVF